MRGGINGFGWMYPKSPCYPPDELGDDDEDANLILEGKLWGEDWLEE